MKYISTKETALKWDVNTSRVLRLAREGRIPGAKLFGNNWMIPENAVKPADGRRKTSKDIDRDAANFRFPIFVDYDEESCYPPLSDEEYKLMKVQKDFSACRFDEARVAAQQLADNCSNRYVRISSLYFCCMLLLLNEEYENYKRYFLALNLALSEDFPYKKEMELWRYSLYGQTVHFQPILDEFFVDPLYSYHPSSVYPLYLLTFYTSLAGDYSAFSKVRPDTYELICKQMELDGHFYEASELHFQLLNIYQAKLNKEMSIYHARRSLEIALEHDHYWASVANLSYYPEIAKEALPDFPEDFVKKMFSLSAFFLEKVNRFDTNQRDISVFNALSSQEYEYIFLAGQGYSNKEVASYMNISEKKVSRIYSNIYQKLEVKSKHEMISKLQSSIRRNMA